VSGAGDETGPGFLRNGGWILVAGLALAVIAVGWHTASLLRLRRHAAVGDGRTVASYRFDLGALTVPRGSIVASGAVKDGVRALVDPGVWTLSDLDAARLERRRRGKVLVARDRVVGVSLRGGHRAYPLRFLAWHEVVNDTLSGEPIAVTYSPLCDSAAVFRRTVAGETLTFGVSGLLLNSNLLLYDRRPGGAGESLWGQLLARAIAGPGAAARHALEPLPLALTTWGEWLARHPDTTLLAPEESMVAEYKREPYGSYFGSDLLRFPVAPLPPAGMPLKTPLVAVRTGTGFAAVTLPAVAARADAGGRWSAAVDGVQLTFEYRDRPASVTVTNPDGESAAAFHAFYFAWYAAHRDDTTWLAPPPQE
jgi:hypothetical protein